MFIIDYYFTKKYENINLEYNYGNKFRNHIFVIKILNNVMR